MMSNLSGGRLISLIFVKHKNKMIKYSADKIKKKLIRDKNFLLNLRMNLIAYSDGLTDIFNLVITNSGNDGLVIDSVYFDSDVFSSGFNDTIIQMGNSISLSIYFTPQE